MLLFIQYIAKMERRTKEEVVLNRLNLVYSHHCHQTWRRCVSGAPVEMCRVSVVRLQQIGACHSTPPVPKRPPFTYSIFLQLSTIASFLQVGVPPSRNTYAITYGRGRQAPVAQNANPRHFWWGLASENRPNRVTAVHSGNDLQF